MRRRLRKLEIDAGFARYGEVEAESEGFTDEEEGTEMAEGVADSRMVISETAAR